MPEFHLKQSGFTFKACRPFAKIHRIQKVREKGNSKHLCRNELGKACFAKILKIDLMKLVDLVNMMDIEEH